MYNILLLLHVLAATIWTGGHLVLALAVLPGVLKRKAPAELLRFESAFEKIGIPALLIQVGSGLALAYRVLPDVQQWFAFADQTSRLIGTKLALLALTMLLAADARLRIIPRLSEKNLTSLAWHIIPVTVVSVLFVVVGVSFRTGWLY
ncbi:MAG: copper resistance protein CopD [Gammaproteobacteria bacterium]|nr:copper resistance protein CopD [Gammaproteobacteria bacterium]